MKFRQKSIRSPTILESKERKKQSAPVQKILVPRSFHNPDDRVIRDSTWFSHVFLPYPIQSAFKAREGRVVIHEAFTATRHETCRQPMRQESDRPRSLWRCFSDIWQACAMKFAQNSKQKRLNGAESTWEGAGKISLWMSFPLNG